MITAVWSRLEDLLSLGFTAGVELMAAGAALIVLALVLRAGSKN